MSKVQEAHVTNVCRFGQLSCGASLPIHAERSWQRPGFRWQLENLVALPSDRLVNSPCVLVGVVRIVPRRVGVTN